MSAARRVTWLGHSTVLIETGGARLLTDPLLRQRVIHLQRQVPRPAVPEADAVLLSHLHYDHLHKSSLKLVAGPEVEAVLPAGAGRHIAKLGFGAVREVSPGDTLTVAGAEVRVLEAWHDGRRRPGTPEHDALGFLVDGVWFPGDTDIDESMASLAGAVDVALLPIWGWGPSLGPGHLDPKGAAEVAALVKPRIAIPIHWGTYLPYGLARSHARLLTDPPREFAAYVAELAPDTHVETLVPGGSLDL